MPIFLTFLINFVRQDNPSLKQPLWSPKVLACVSLGECQNYTSNSATLEVHFYSTFRANKTVTEGKLRLEMRACTKQVLLKTYDGLETRIIKMPQ